MIKRVWSLTHGEPRSLQYAEAIATPFSFSKLANHTTGALYDWNGIKISLSERPPGVKGDRYFSVAPQTIETASVARRLVGQSIYLGHFMGRHYGHFLLETLSTFWALLTPHDFNHYVFHPFVFGREITPFAEAFLSAFDIPPPRVRIITDVARLEEVVVPQRLVHLNDHMHTRMRDVYRRLVSRLSLASGTTTPERIYLSRRAVGALTRRITNEEAIEDIFRRHDFEVVRPESLPMSEQVSLCSGAKMIAGCSGSQLHNIVLSTPGTRLIEVRDHRPPNINQHMCNEVAEANYSAVPFQGIRHQKSGTLDLGHVADCVARLMDEPTDSRESQPTLSLPSERA